MVTERTTIIFGKEQLTNIEAYLKSISTSLEALLDIYNLVVPRLVPDLCTEEEEAFEAELKDVLTKLLKLF